MARTQITNRQILNKSLTGADLNDSIGLFDETKQYNPGDIVEWNKTRYICVNQTTPTEGGDLTYAPDVSPDWELYGFDGNTDLIKMKRLFTTGEVPTSAHEGELVINIPDKKIWVGDNSLTPIEFVSPSGGGEIGDLYLNDLVDVSASYPDAGDRLAWDEDEQLWVPKRSLSALGIMEFEYTMTLPPDSTPSPRHISRNDDDPAQTTILYLHERDQTNADISLFIKEMRAGDWLNLHKKRDTTIHEDYDIIGDPVQNGDVWEIPVTPYGNAGSISNNNRVRLFWRIQGQDTDKYREPMGSGIHHGGQISQGSNDLEVVVSEGRGIIIDATTDPFKIKRHDLIWPDTTITIDPISALTQEIHMVFVDVNGDILSEPVQNIDHKLIYDYIRLGWVEVSQNQIVNVVPAPSVVGQTTSNVADLYYSINDNAKSEGLRLQPCTDRLSLFCEKGELLIPGINWFNDRKNANVIDIPQEGDETTPIKFQVFNRNAVPVMEPAEDLPKYYDNNGNTEPLTGGEAVIHYIYWSSAGYSLQLGQKNYIDFADAFRNADRDLDTFEFAPGANVSGRSILLGQVIISKHADDFNNKSLADIISTINDESGNTISPVDLTLVPQYLLRTTAAQDLSAGDELSMDVNGNVQKYPATGGEGSSQYTNDAVILHSAVYLDNTNSQGMIAWVVDGTSKIYYRVAQGNPDGTISYSPIASHDTNGIPVAMRICYIDSGKAGIIWSDSGGTRMSLLINNGLSSAPGISSVKTIDSSQTSIKGVDCVFDSDNSNLIGVYSINNIVYNRYCYVHDGHYIDDPPTDRVSMTTGSQVRCVSEGNNVIISVVDGDVSRWREAAWSKRNWWWDGEYNDMTNEVSVSDCYNHCGLQVQSGNVLSQFENGGVLTTYITSYSSGNSMDTPSQFSMPLQGKWADLINTESGIGYSVVLTQNNNIEIYEGSIQGDYELTYTSLFTVNPANTEIQGLMFGSIFAFGIGYHFDDAHKVFLINSSVTRTDHFIGVCPYDVLQGQKVNVDIALPLITLPREYPPGTTYFYGPYKYQVITHNQAVIIIEATTMQASVTLYE
jgi:hypothetical protein